MNTPKILAMVAIVAALGLVGAVSLPLIDTAYAAENCQSRGIKDHNALENGCGWAGARP